METRDASGKFFPTLSRKGDFKYFYYFEYYPNRFDVSEEYHDRRKAIWSFKEGKKTEILADYIKSQLEYLELSKPYSDWWLCVIPASTQEKNRIRFESFCNRLCNDIQINNGYSLLTVKEDRGARHKVENRNTIGIIRSITFGDISGKKILLFDDIYTTGKSFLSVSKELKARGATEVVGLFFGKTHWLEDGEEI